MKKLGALNCKAFVLAGALFTLPSISYAQPTWDIDGCWSVGGIVEGNLVILDMCISNEDYATGSFSAIDNYGYQVSGTVSGSSIQFSDPIVALYFEGSISTNGIMSGAMQYFSGSWWNGSFGTGEGQAVPYAALMFAVQPVSQVIDAGQPVTFTALATGDPTPTYQWQFDGTSIADATNSSLSLSLTGITNLGFYDVVASSSLGTNVSATVSLSFFNIQLFPGVVLYGPIGQAYNIQESPVLGGRTNWTTITNITLTAMQPFIYFDYSAITNQAMFYRALPL